MAQDTSATVTGYVTDPGGAAILRVDADLSLEGPPHTLFSVRAGDDGRFKLTVLPAGIYTLTLAYAGSGFRKLTLKSIHVASGEQKILPPLRLDLAPSGCGGGPVVDHFELLPTEQPVGNLSGRVERDEAHPIARATVRLLCGERKVCGETKTDSNGEFIFFDLPPRGDVTIRATHPGFYSAQGTDYEIRQGFNSTYWPIILNSKLRPKPPVVSCE